MMLSSPEAFDPVLLKLFVNCRHHPIIQHGDAGTNELAVVLGRLWGQCPERVCQSSDPGNSGDPGARET
jgi:hypothetical protein